MTTIVEEIFVTDSDDDSIIIIPYVKPLPPTIELLDSDHENNDDQEAQKAKETPESEKPKKKHHRKDKNKNRDGKESPNKSSKRKAHKRNNNLVEELFSVLDVPIPSSSTNLSRDEGSIITSTNVISGGGDHEQTTLNLGLATNNQESANGTDNRITSILSQKDCNNSDKTGISSKEAKDSSSTNKQSLSSTSKKSSLTTSPVSSVPQNRSDDDAQTTKQLQRPKFSYELTEAQKKKHPRLQEIINERMKERREQDLLKNNKNNLATKKKSHSSNSTKKTDTTRRKQNFDAEYDHALFLKTLNLEGFVGLNDQEIQALASGGTTLSSKLAQKFAKGSSKRSKNLGHKNKSPSVVVSSLPDKEVDLIKPSKNNSKNNQYHQKKKHKDEKHGKIDKAKSKEGLSSPYFSMEEDQNSPNLKATLSRSPSLSSKTTSGKQHSKSNSNNGSDLQKKSEQQQSKTLDGGNVVVDLEKSLEENRDAALHTTGQQQQSNELHNKQKRKQQLDEKSSSSPDDSNQENGRKRRKTNEDVEISAPPPPPPSDLNCSEFPDCKNNNTMGNACYKVNLSREEHRLLLQVDKDATIIKKLSDQFSHLDVNISLLRESPQVHLSGQDYDDVRDKIFALMYKLKSLGPGKCVEFILEEYSNSSSTKSKNVLPATVQNTATFVLKGNSPSTTTTTTTTTTPPIPPRTIVRRITNENALGLKNKTAKRESRWSSIQSHPFSLPPSLPPPSVNRTAFFPAAPSTITQVTIDTTHDIDERNLPADARANVTVPLFSPTSPFYYPLGYADYVRRQQQMMVPDSSAPFNMDSFANAIIADNSNGFFVQPQTVSPPSEVTPTLIEGQDFIRPGRSSSTNCVPPALALSWTERRHSSSASGTAEGGKKDKNETPESMLESVKVGGVSARKIMMKTSGKGLSSSLQQRRQQGERKDKPEMVVLLSEAEWRKILPPSRKHPETGNPGFLNKVRDKFRVRIKSDKESLKLYITGNDMERVSKAKYRIRVWLESGSWSDMNPTDKVRKQNSRDNSNPSRSMNSNQQKSNKNNNNDAPRRGGNYRPIKDQRGRGHHHNSGGDRGHHHNSGGDRGHHHNSGGDRGHHHNSGGDRGGGERPPFSYDRNNSSDSNWKYNEYSEHSGETRIDHNNDYNSFDFFGNPIRHHGSYSVRPFHGQPHNRGGDVWR